MASSSRWHCQPSSSPYRGGGSSKEPSHTTYNPLLTSKSAPPIIGLTGLHNLLMVVRQLQAAQRDGVGMPQEGGAPCPLSPVAQINRSVLPPAPEGPEGANAQPVGAVAAHQSAAAPLPAQSSRRTPVEAGRPASTAKQRGGRP